MWQMSHDTPLLHIWLWAIMHISTFTGTDYFPIAATDLLIFKTGKRRNRKPLSVKYI